MSDLGKRLLNLRLKKGLSLSELARDIGVSPSTYREWEQGRKIKGEPYEKLALILGVSINELLTGKKHKIDVFLEDIESAVKGIRSLL